MLLKDNGTTSTEMMIEFAKQFIDLAAEEAIDMKYEVYPIEKNSGLRQRVWNSVYATPKQSILNIKELIK